MMKPCSVNRFSRLVLALATLHCLLAALTVTAFAPQLVPIHRATTTTELRLATRPEDEQASSSEPQKDRRALLLMSFSSLAAMTLSPPRAHATYSAYTHREQDWERRQKAGEVQISNAKALRQQLREIAPMNSERSKVFCPNGTPSSVSPLMENKCNDRETMPSVFGRTEDVVGNSIPGFASGNTGASYKYAAAGSSPSMSIQSLGGGFPEYSKAASMNGSR